MFSIIFDGIVDHTQQIFIFPLERYYCYGGNIGFRGKHSMEFSTDLLILIDHADGIIACLVWFSCSLKKWNKMAVFG